MLLYQTPLLNHRGVQKQLTISALNGFLFHRALGNKLEYLHRFCLTDTMSTLHFRREGGAIGLINRRKSVFIVRTTLLNDEF
jgi:hypothetical protein